MFNQHSSFFHEVKIPSPCSVGYLWVWVQACSYLFSSFWIKTFKCVRPLSDLFPSSTPACQIFNSRAKNRALYCVQLPQVKICSQTPFLFRVTRWWRKIMTLLFVSEHWWTLRPLGGTSRALDGRWLRLSRSGICNCVCYYFWPGLEATEPCGEGDKYKPQCKHIVQYDGHHQFCASWIPLSCGAST